MISFNNDFVGAYPFKYNDVVVEMIDTSINNKIRFPYMVPNFMVAPMITRQRAPVAKMERAMSDQ